jgi:hypothetical protein
MTTVAWDGKTLATDSRATESDGSARTDRFVKLYRINSKVAPIVGEVLLAAAGCEFAGQLFLEWLKKGGVPDLHIRGVVEDPEGESPLDVLLVHKSGAYVANHLGCFIKVRDKFWAHGTGRQGALCLMAEGKSAAYAVKAVSRFDNDTGGRIVAMSLKGGK